MKLGFAARFHLFRHSVTIEKRNLASIKSKIMVLNDDGAMTHISKSAVDNTDDRQ